MLSRLVTDFLPRSKCHLISWLQSPFAVILEPKKIKSLTVSIVSPFTCHEIAGKIDGPVVKWLRHGPVVKTSLSNAGGVGLISS